ncbi:MAG: YggS family pyridoxal phosphate-dependent enzyme [Melioribacteraceae bacterium]
MISENLKKIEAEINETCLKSGRNRAEIKLIAVSKTQPLQQIGQILECGVKNLGENKAQELRDKSELISGNFHLHFIGHLQTNKVKYIIKAADYIHTVDSVKLAEEISRRCRQIDKKQTILIEIKTSDEVSKSGLQSEDEIYKLVEYCRNDPNLNLVGLMTMAALTDEERVVRDCFINLRRLKEKIVSNGFQLSELSMGMTNDFKIAIQEGATMLRIGTAIFGEKNKN